MREEIYRIYEKANEIKPLIRERHAKDAIKSLISSFDKKVQVCAAVEEHQKNKIEAAKKIEEEKEKNKQELEKEKKDKRRKSKGARKSSDKTVEEELQECVEQMTLPEEDEKDDAEASSSDAVQEVPKKKAKKTPPAKAHTSQRSKSSQSGDNFTDMESPKVFISQINYFYVLDHSKNTAIKANTTQKLPGEFLVIQFFTFHCPIYSTHSASDLHGNH